MELPREIDEFRLITIVRDKLPQESWRSYAARSAKKFGLSREVKIRFQENRNRGLSAREAAVEALELFCCEDNENREETKVYNFRQKWVPRPRLLRLPNVLLKHIDITFEAYRKIGRNHTEIVLDDSEVQCLLVLLLSFNDPPLPDALKKVAREGANLTRALMRGPRARQPIRTSGQV